MTRQEELNFQQGLFVNQLILIGQLILAGLGLLIIEYFFPDFFNYPYLKWTVDWKEVLRYWPVLAWGIALSLFFGRKCWSSKLDESILKWGLLTSLLAGIWEEIGFRCFFICYAMIALMFLNWILGTFVLWLFVCILIVAGVKFLLESKDEPGILIAGIIGITLGIFLIWTGIKGFEPVYWVYNKVLIPVLDFVSLGSLKNLFVERTGENHSLFIMGAVLANAWFRDAHKYQGTLGMINSFVLGFVFLHATVTYGLLTAMVLHVVYNALIDLFKYGMAKYNGKPSFDKRFEFF